MCPRKNLGKKKWGETLKQTGDPKRKLDNSGVVGPRKKKNSPKQKLCSGRRKKKPPDDGKGGGEER